MRRKKLSKKTSKKIFKKTARITVAKNVTPPIMRGGISL